MKKIILKFILLTISLIVTSCNSNNEDLSSINNELIGTWDLIETTGMIPSEQIFNVGEVTWTFGSDNFLIVENTIPTSDSGYIYTILSSGTYPYFIDPSDSESLVVDSEVIGKINIDGTKMLLNDGVELDGLLTEFLKN